MASTPSASLRLELMATGDQSGTWGTTTNTNLGTLLEQAITGYLSVAQGDVANLTLTTTNYASDQARNAVIRVTGALTATRNVVVQTAAKLYTIANDTTGGFSIVVKTSGGTGVSVPPGAMVDVYSDGTNVVQAANYWTGSIGGMVYLDAGAAVGPNFDLFRDSTSPAISDILGRVSFNGRDSAGNKQEYGSIESVITSPTSTTEGGSLDFYAVVAGTRTLVLSAGQYLGLPTATAPTPIVEGALGWDTDDDAIVVGDGAAQKIFRPTMPPVAVTPSATTSSTVTGVPSWVTRIDISLNALSVNGATAILFQLGDSGGLENTGYVEYHGAMIAAAVSSAAGTTGFFVSVALAASAPGGVILLRRSTTSSLMWAVSYTGADAGGLVYSAGHKTLSAALDRFGFVSNDGSSTFDAGSYTYTWQ